MTPVERLQAAIDKLEALKAESHNWRVPITADEDGPQVIHDFETEGHGPGSGALAWTTSDAAAENIVTLHRTIDAQLTILRLAVEYGELVGGQGSRFTASALALADAILGSDA